MQDKIYTSKLDPSINFMFILFASFAALGIVLLATLKYRLGWNIDGNIIPTAATAAIVFLVVYYCFYRYRYVRISGQYLNSYICLLPIDSISIGSIDKVSHRKAARLKNGQHHFNQSSPPGYLSIQGRFAEQEIIVSVMDKKEFIDHLLAINPNIAIDI